MIPTRLMGMAEALPVADRFGRRPPWLSETATTISLLDAQLF
jgi:hypothetical protein